MGNVDPEKRNLEKQELSEKRKRGSDSSDRRNTRLGISKITRHDLEYEGLNLEQRLAIISNFSAMDTVQVTEDFTFSLDSSIYAKHGDTMLTVSGLDIQSMCKQLVNIYCGETKFKNLEKNNAAAGVTFMVLSVIAVDGVELEDQIILGKHLVGSAGDVKSYGMNFDGPDVGEVALDESEEMDAALADYLGGESCPGPLMEILETSGNRRILFDNKTKDDIKKCEQVNRLLNLGNKVVCRNGRAYADELLIQLQIGAQELLEQVAKVNSIDGYSELQVDLKLNKNTVKLVILLEEGRACRIEAEKVAKEALEERAARLEEEKAALVEAEKLAKLELKERCENERQLREELLSKEQRKAYFKEYDHSVKFLLKSWREKLKRIRERKMSGKCSVSAYGSYEDDPDSGASAPIAVSLADMALPASFDSDDLAYRYHFLEPTSKFLTRPSLDSHSWDHDCVYDGVNLEHSLAIINRFPATYMVQVTKDKKDFTFSFDSSILPKHGDKISTMAGFDIQIVGKQLGKIFCRETKLKNLKNKAADRVTFTVLGENVIPGVKIEDQITLGKQYILVRSAGAVKSQQETAYGANFDGPDVGEIAVEAQLYEEAFKQPNLCQVSKLSKEQSKAYFEEYNYSVKLLQKKSWTEELKRIRETKKRGKDSVFDYGFNAGNPVSGASVAISFPLADMALPASFNGDNLAYRYRLFEPTSQFLARPDFDSHGWDHGCGYDGVNLECNLDIINRFSATYTVQVTKDKKDFTFSLDSSILTKHGDKISTMGGFDIMIVGKQLTMTGNCKHGTGNSILGDMAFLSKSNSVGVTGTTELRTAVLENGQTLNVIETPGLLDYSRKPEFLRDKILKCIKMAKDGIDVVLLVLSVRSRFSVEGKTAVGNLLEFFGGKISEYMIVVFTGGDELNEINETLAVYLDNNCPDELKEILEVCGNRRVLFDDVLFAGYKLPHPLQYKTIIRIHTSSQSLPMQAYNKGINDHDKELDHLKKELEMELAKHEGKLTEDY